MATELESTRQPMNKGEEVSYTLHFIKDCDCGEKINEHLLPNLIREPDLTSLFSTCVDCLICANTRLDSKKIVSMLIRSLGKYSEIAIEDRTQLRQLLDKLCEVCGACPNFINEEEIKKCLICDNEEENELLIKEVIFVAFSTSQRV